VNKHCAHWIAAASLAGCLGLSTAASAQGSPPAAGMVSSVDVTARVTHIDHKSRSVTLKGDDGSVTKFVVDPVVKNLDQVKRGDVVTVTYTEALAYEVTKGGSKPGSESSVASATAAPGAKPAGFVSTNTTVTVPITAMDANVPSLTIKTTEGDLQTIKLKSADKLQGLSIGDTVTVSYTEAVALKVEKPKK